MKMFLAKITIKLRSSILDVQGEAVMGALVNMNFNKITHVRVGKYIEVEIKANSLDEAMIIANQMCHDLLVNPIMEDYELEVVSKN